MTYIQDLHVNFLLISNHSEHSSAIYNLRPNMLHQEVTRLYLLLHILLVSPLPLQIIITLQPLLLLELLNLLINHRSNRSLLLPQQLFLLVLKLDLQGQFVFIFKSVLPLASNRILSLVINQLDLPSRLDPPRLVPTSAQVFILSHVVNYFVLLSPSVIRLMRLRHEHLSEYVLPLLHHPSCHLCLLR